MKKEREDLYNFLVTGGKTNESKDQFEKRFENASKVQEFFNEIIEHREKNISFWGQILPNENWDNPVNRRKTLSKFYAKYICGDTSPSVSWAQTTSYCTGIEIEVDDKKLSKYTGTFLDEDDSKGTIFSINLKKSKDKNRISVTALGLPAEYSNLYLKPTKENTFELDISGGLIGQIGAGQIVFDDDFNGFTYDLKIDKGRANRIDEQKKQTKPTKQKKLDNKPVVTKNPEYKLYQSHINFGEDKPIKVDNIPTTGCTSFPFKFGCVNTKIGDMNNALLGDRIENTYDSHLYQVLRDNAYFKDVNEKEGEISEKIYKKVMTIKENITRKKVIKEIVKKVLKESIIKKK